MGIVQGRLTVPYNIAVMTGMFVMMCFEVLPVLILYVCVLLKNETLHRQSHEAAAAPSC